MLHPEFGLIDPVSGKRIEADLVIQHVLAQAKVAMCPADTAIVLREKYETLLGIYNHDHPPGPPRPLASIAMHWAEDASGGSLLYERIEQFEERKIHQRFGLSLTEFFELPRDVCRKIMEVAGERIKEESKVAGQAAEQIANAEKRP